MKTYKRLFCVTVALAIALASLAGCADTTNAITNELEKTIVDQSDLATLDYDPETVVAEVNGVEIKARQVLANLRDFVEGLGLDDISQADDQQKEYIADHKWTELEDAVKWELQRQKVKELGFLPLTNEEESLAVQMSEANLDYLRNDAYNSIMDYYGDVENIEEIANEARDEVMQKLLDENGITSEEQYPDVIKDELRIENMYDSLAKQANAVSEQDIKDYYDELVNEQKGIEPDELSQYSIIAYYPAETRQVLGIFADMSEADWEEIMMEMDDDESYKLYQDIFASKKTLIEAAQKRLENGEKFEDVLHDKSITGDLSDEESATMIITKPGNNTGSPEAGDESGEIDAVDELDKAAFELEKPGDISGIVEYSNGYAILKYMKDMPEGVVPLDSIKDQIKETLSFESQANYTTELLQGWYDEWLKSGKIVLYSERIGL